MVSEGGERTGAETVGGDVNDVVGAGHDMHVAVFVNHAGVASVDPFAVEAFHVAFVESLVIVEERREAGWRKRYSEYNIPHAALFNFVPRVVYGSDVKAGHGFACGSGLDG